MLFGDHSWHRAGFMHLDWLLCSETIFWLVCHMRLVYALTHATWFCQWLVYAYVGVYAQLTTHCESLDIALCFGCLLSFWHFLLTVGLCRRRLVRVCTLCELSYNSTALWIARMYNTVVMYLWSVCFATICEGRVRFSWAARFSRWDLCGDTSTGAIPRAPHF